MRPAHLSSTPKLITSPFLGIAVLAGSLLHCNGILGDFSVGNAGDGGGSGSGSDSATGGSADAASDSSTDATVQTNQDAGSDASADSPTAPLDAATDGASDDAADAADATPQCPAGEAYCSGACVNITSSPGDCGGCGHTCSLTTLYGSSSCDNGVCAPLEFIAFVGEQFVDIAADEGHVFVHVVLPDGGSTISECPASSCDNLVTFQSDTNTAPDMMLASGGIVAWWARFQGQWTDDDGGASSATPHYGIGAGIRTMSVGGGNVGYLWFDDLGNQLTVVAAAGYNWTASFDAGSMTAPVAMDSANAVFQLTVADGGGSTETCSIASGCTTAAPIGPATPFANVLTPYAYLGLPAPPSVDAGPTIAYVPLTPPANAPLVLTRLAPTVSLVQTAIDSTGFYWLDSAGNISMCPLAPATCPTGGVPVVRGSPGSVATQFAVSNGSVFFLMASTPDEVYEAEPPP